MVEYFLNTMNIYKKGQTIDDDRAVEGLPLLLECIAETWWQGVKTVPKTWTEAADVIQEAFAPKP